MCLIVIVEFIEFRASNLWKTFSSMYVKDQKKKWDSDWSGPHVAKLHVCFCFTLFTYIFIRFGPGIWLCYILQPF